MTLSLTHRIEALYRCKCGDVQGVSGDLTSNSPIYRARLSIICAACGTNGDADLAVSVVGAETPADDGEFL